jgi:hypothetical protein
VAQLHIFLPHNHTRPTGVLLLSNYKVQWMRMRPGERARLVNGKVCDTDDLACVVLAVCWRMYPALVSELCMEDSFDPSRQRSVGQHSGLLHANKIAHAYVRCQCR